MLRLSNLNKLISITRESKIMDLRNVSKYPKNSTKPSSELKHFERLCHRLATPK